MASESSVGETRDSGPSSSDEDICIKMVRVRNKCRQELLRIQVGARWPGLVTTSKSGMKQARAIKHVRQTKIINFRIICDLSFPEMTNTPGLVLVLPSINSVLALPYFRSTMMGNLVATALTNARYYTSAEHARGISPAMIRLCHQQRKVHHSWHSHTRAGVPPLSQKR